MRPMYARPHRRRSRYLRRLALIALVVILGSVGAVVVDAFGAGDAWQKVLDRVDRFVAGPVPDRTSVITVVVTPPPTASPTVPPTIEPGATPTPLPLPTPTRAPVDFRIDADPQAVFAHEIRDTWCSPAGVQMALAVLGLADTSDAFQRKLASRVHEWESYDDSHNGGWGPAAMAEALAAYGAPGYAIHAYATREQALHDSAVAIATTEAPVILLAWRGAHTWVMTGYRADADPVMYADATVSGTYILDPWYPNNSRIWGPSDPAGTFQDAAEMVRNFLPWKRPEGKYPDRDGRFIVLIPTLGPGLGS
ncbi:MAG: hypothetical protein ABI573_10435 [Chloroflexota bacterium]